MVVLMSPGAMDTDDPIHTQYNMTPCISMWVGVGSPCSPDMPDIAILIRQSFSLPTAMSLHCNYS